jgi:hypothetical protein
MPRDLDPFRALSIAVEGWIDQQKQFAIHYQPRGESRASKGDLATGGIATS